MHTKIIQNHFVSISASNFHMFSKPPSHPGDLPSPPTPPAPPRTLPPAELRCLAESACRGARNTVRRAALERLVLQVAALNGCANGCSKGRGDLGIQVRQGGNIVGTWFVLFWMEGDDVFGGEWNCMKLLWKKCGNFRMESLGNAVFEGLEKSRNVIASLRRKESGLTLSQL